ncbi:hypothetical protein LMC05_12310 [Limosilactobacillus reuteri]|uniref:hypothetical protein n=1 Tax=Limosilactobacillus reuteri TaxID=1598 RepID=UPI001E58DA03|nr:hypothetical protein [Limosilactobacillus reuteri]MCC4509770.1 hypothetical protein [Limosilactobacillus reuteri]
MKVTWGKWSADAYPVEPFVYEVVANGKKEFYQAAWDAFRSDLHMKNATAKIIKIPVTPMSDYEIETERLYFELGDLRDYPHVEEFKNDKPKATKPKPKITFSEMMDILSIVAWIICMSILLITSILTGR